MAKNLQKSYRDHHTDFEIADIEYENDADSTADPIEFQYTAPSISVDVSGRFATHEIIGGSTVRQKIGEEPIQATINGVCSQSTARQLDGLRDAEFGTIFSERLVGGSLDVHFASSSTSPLEDSGAVGIADKSGEFLHSFTLSVVEVNVKPEEPALEAQDARRAQGREPRETGPLER
jgi:hypothetical protein